MTINNVTAVRSDISEMLSKIREISNNSKVFSSINQVKPSAQVNAPKGFDNIFNAAKDALTQVNSLQNNTDKVRDAYISGDKDVSMAQVLIASQKSKLAFEGLITVRNKILESYKEIMNMQV